MNQKYRRLSDASMGVAVILACFLFTATDVVSEPKRGAGLYVAKPQTLMCQNLTVLRELLAKGIVDTAVAREEIPAPPYCIEGFEGQQVGTPIVERRRSVKTDGRTRRERFVKVKVGTFEYWLKQSDLKRSRRK